MATLVYNLADFEYDKTNSLGLNPNAPLTKLFYPYFTRVIFTPYSTEGEGKLKPSI